MSARLFQVRPVMHLSCLCTLVHTVADMRAMWAAESMTRCVRVCARCRALRTPRTLHPIPPSPLTHGWPG